MNKLTETYFDVDDKVNAAGRERMPWGTFAIIYSQWEQMLIDNDVRNHHPSI